MGVVDASVLAGARGGGHAGLDEAVGGRGDGGSGGEGGGEEDEEGHEGHDGAEVRHIGIGLWVCCFLLLKVWGGWWEPRGSGYCFVFCCCGLELNSYLGDDSVGVCFVDVYSKTELSFKMEWSKRRVTHKRANRLDFFHPALYTTLLEVNSMTTSCHPTARPNGKLVTRPPHKCCLPADEETMHRHPHFWCRR